MKDRSAFSEQIDRFERRIGDLQLTSRRPDEPSRELLDRALEELSNSLEEIRTAQEEIARQNRELNEIHARIDLDRLRYQELFRAAPHGYILTDDCGTIGESNLAAAELFGVDAARMAGRPLPLLVADPDRPRFRSWLGEIASRAETADSGEFLMHSAASDRMFPCRITFSIAGDFRGKEPSLRWTLVDLTDQQRARQRDWFEERATQKDDFLAVLGHELRNPLAAIWLAAQVLESEATPLGQRAGKTAAIILRHAAQLTRLVDDLLDISRVCHGKVTLQCEEVDLGEVVARAVETVQPVVQRKHHTLEVHRNEKPLRTFGDPVRLQQVVANLLVNASKYTPPGGRIEVRLRQVGDRAAVSVRDFGIGISADRIDRIFDLFEQGGAPSTAGLGVGLTLARELILMHSGAIEVRSQGLDRGSEFLVTLPLDDPRTAKAEPPRSPGHDNGKPTGDPVTVLIVDDNRDAAEVLGMSLEHLGHRVSVAFSGEKALERVEGASVALVDLSMPGMDGFELARRLRLSSPDLKLVAVTGFGDEGNRAAAGRAGFDRYILKPVNVMELDAILRSR